MSRYIRIRLLLVVGIVVIGATVWFVGRSERTAANESSSEIAAGRGMLEAMLDQETGLRGYLLTRRADFLQPYEQGRRNFEVALDRARSTAYAGQMDELRGLAAQENAARGWQALAEQDRALVAGGGHGGGLAAILQRKAFFDAFRKANATYLAHRFTDEHRRQSQAQLGTVLAIAVIGLLIATAGYLFVERGARADDRRREQHTKFVDAIQVTRDETEAYDVLKRHVEQTIRGSEAVVLIRNNSANRLEARTGLAEGSCLARALAAAEPESCLAIRGGRRHQRDGQKEALLSCPVCGGSPSKSTCLPSLVGGEVVGAVLVEHDGSLDRHQSEELQSSVNESAPVIANLRNLAIAELRASTDALTGLPNKRSVHENLSRMAAYAGRAMAPLAAVVFDLDHFKQINDTSGHDRGDEVLAAVGAAANNAVRGSDLAGRFGGEEFILLLPGTNREGAVTVAEKLRTTISTIAVPGVPRTLSASFGVAVLPDDAPDGESLVRAADRALYMAKATGRNRVETVPDLDRIET
jgi:diguanylate cyclase (GGDEF)-like protein